MKQSYVTFTASLFTVGLLVSVGLSPLAPAFAHYETDPQPLTIAEVAKEDAQSYRAPANVKPVELDRSSYSATTPEELKAIQEAKAAAEAARLKAEQEAAAKAEAEKRAAERVKLASSAAPKMSGVFAWPVTDFTSNWDNNGFQTPSRPDHNGYDMMTAAGNPIFAAHDGTVIASSESMGGYGVVVMVEGVIDGQRIVTTYAHMTYGTRLVEVGQKVTAGTQLGSVGMTGRATAPHLHFEVKINGSLVDPASWLKTNLG